MLLSDTWHVLVPGELHHSAHNFNRKVSKLISSLFMYLWLFNNAESNPEYIALLLNSERGSRCYSSDKRNYHVICFMKFT